VNTNSRQKDFWERRRRRRSPDHKVVEAFVGPKIDFVADRVALPPDVTILDVGCGNGYFTYHVARLGRTVGLDYSCFMLSINPCRLLVQGSAYALPFPECSFDVAFCSDLLHHVENPVGIVREMKRVTREYVVVSEPNRNNPLMLIFCLLNREEHREIHFSLSYLQKLLTQAGLVLLDNLTQGLVFPNRLPTFALPLVQRLEASIALAAT